MKPGRAQAIWGLAISLIGLWVALIVSDGRRADEFVVIMLLSQGIAAVVFLISAYKSPRRTASRYIAAPACVVCALVAAAAYLFVSFVYA